MKYTNNPEFIKFFQEFLDKNSLYTILTFKKGTQAEKNSSKNLSVAIAYNHKYCKIERFLINYEYSYDIKPSETLLNTFHHIPNNNNGKPEHNFISDGKFSKNFMTFFIFHLILTKIRRDEPNYKIKDIRAIDYLYSKDIDLLSDIIEEDYSFIEDNQELPIIINIPDKYCTVTYKDMYSKHYNNQVEILPYRLNDLPPAIQYIRRHICGKTFVDNIKLEQQIEMVNTHLLNKGKMFIQKELYKEYAEIFDVNPRKR